MRRRFPGLWLGCALLATAGPGQVPEIPDSPHLLELDDVTVELPVVDGRRFGLGAGPKVFFAVDRTLPLIEISLAIRGGASLDPAGKSGLTYLTAAQMRRGGAGPWDADTFDDRVDDIGARLDTVSGTTRTGVNLSVPSWSLDKALDLLFAMLTEPRFQTDRLASARSNLLESMSNRNVDPLAVLEREWQWLLYGEDHFTSRSLTPASLAEITIEEMRSCHRRVWHPDAMILAISGDFDPTRMHDELERRFAAWPEGSIEPAIAPWPPAPPSPSKPPGLYHYEMDVPQAKVLVGRRLPRRLDWTSRERFVLEVLTEILGGGGAISRIAGRLRTAESLVYRASARLSPGDLWPGELQIFFETQSRTTARAVELTLEEIERLRNDPVHPRELEVVKQSLLANLRLTLDTAEEVAGFFAEDLLLDRPHDFRQAYLDAVASVTATEIQNAAKKVLAPESFLFLIVGRWNDISAAAPPGESDLEHLLGAPRIALPPRDPLSLLPLDNS